jgi:hypothetical protein
MSLNLENSSGLTANFGNAVFSNSGAGNTQVATSTATTVSTAGVVSNFAIRSTAVYASVLDANTAAVPPGIVGGKGAVVVSGLVAGALTFVQGPIVNFPAGSAIGSVVFPLPSIPTGFCPIAYQVIKNKNTAGTANFIYADTSAGLFNAANVSFETAIQVCQLPNAGITNAAV